MRRLIHRLAHLLGWNGGTVVSFSIEGRTWVGFRCNGCGDVSDAHCADDVIDRLLAGGARTGGRR